MSVQCGRNVKTALSHSKPGLEHKKTQDMFATSGYAKLSHNTKSISHKRKVDKLE